MRKILYIFLIIFQKLISNTPIESFKTLDTGEKGAALTSFTNDLYIISSSKRYNIINQNYNIIKDNKNSANTNFVFSNNFEIVESSINKIKNESIILIGENRGNKINLYSFNITAPINGNNPKLLDRTNSAVENSKISLIKIGNGKYLLSYILTGNKFENKVFKYISYDGYRLLGKFQNNGDVYNYISCFLLYEQIPICYYSEKRIVSTDVKCYQNIIALDIVFNNNYDRVSKYEFNENDNCLYNKAIYLSNDYAVFCYMVDDDNKLHYEIKKLTIEFHHFQLGIDSTPIDGYLEDCNCQSNLNKIDLIKVEDYKFLIGCINIDNQKIYIKLITVNINYNSVDTQNHIINQNVRSTLTLFTHTLSYSNNNYYGIIFNDNDNKIKYGYLDLPICTNKIDKEILELIFTETEENKFKLSEYLEISIENEISSCNNNYKIVSFISIDNDKNAFNYNILKPDETPLNIGDIISEDDDLIINPINPNVFSSGKFYIEVAPLRTGNIQGRSCKFEFDTKCYESCSACNSYDNEANEFSKHNCLSCKSNYYSLSDLCLKDCSLIKGYHNIFKTKECIYEEQEYINDCPYKIWYIDPTTGKDFCSNSNFCPQNIPYVYTSSGECIESCRYSELISRECYISNIIGGVESSINSIEDEIFSLGDNIFDYNDENKINKSIVIYGNNITIEITDSLKINNIINFNKLISEFQFNECVNNLKATIGREDIELIIVKIDLRRNDTLSAQIEYEIFDPITKEPFDDLSSCNNIIIYTPIFASQSYLNKIKEIYDEGYDIFNINAKFYSDLCLPFYDKNFNADLTLGKRQKIYYYINANLCEAKCKYIGFDIAKYKAICDCPIKQEISLDISNKNIFNSKENEQTIYYKETISNFKTAKCFKTIFSKIGFKYNWGSYFMMLMIIGFIIFTIIWFKKGEDMILSYIREILDIILMGIDSAYKEKVKKNYEEMINKSKNKNKKKIMLNESKELNDTEENDDNNNKENNITKDKEIINSDQALRDKENEIFRKKGPKKNAILIRSIGLKKENKMPPEKLILEKKKINYNNNLTDIEKDLLSYDKAKIMDNRNYYGYYWSLIKYRQLILFTFFSFDDYNFFYIKIISFFLLLSLNLLYNYIFFFDKIIDEIYDNEGKYSLKIHILNIFICSILFSLTILLCRLIITSHKKFIKLKEFDKYEMAQKESYSIYKKLIIRYIIFISVGALLLLIIWYFITGFCAIFHYTHNHLFINAFFSFLFSMIYPFIYCLLPTLFRHFGLKKNKKNYYCFSQYI